MVLSNIWPEWTTDTQTHSYTHFSHHKHQPVQMCKQGSTVGALHNRPLGCSVTPELCLFISLSCFYFFIYQMHLPVFFTHFLSYHTLCCLSSFHFLSPSILIEMNIFYSAFLLIHPPIYPFPYHPYLFCIFCNSLKYLWFFFCCFLVCFSPIFSLSVISFSLFILGAGCLPASCRECQQDVLCHHRPVKDQQHVPLQPCFFSAPLPKGSSGQEGDWIPHNSYSASISIQHSSVKTCLSRKIVQNIVSLN